MQKQVEVTEQDLDIVIKLIEAQVLKTKKEFQLKSNALHVYEVSKAYKSLLDDGLDAYMDKLFKAYTEEPRDVRDD